MFLSYLVTLTGLTFEGALIQSLLKWFVCQSTAGFGSIYKLNRWPTSFLRDSPAIVSYQRRHSLENEFENRSSAFPRPMQKVAIERRQD